MQFISPLLISRATSIFAIVLGLIVLFGWAFNINALTRILPGLITMKPNTAVGFILGGIALTLQTTTQFERTQQWLAGFLATLILLLGITTLSQYIFGLNIGIDQLLFQVPPDVTYSEQYPNRMSQHSALLFSLLGSSILLLRRPQTRVIAQYLSLSVLLISFSILIGYLFGVTSLAFIPSYKPMGVHSVFGYVALSISILATTLEIGVLLALRKQLPVIAFALGFGLLILSSIAFITNTQRISEINFRATQMHEVLERVEKIATDIELNIAAYRGFVLTGQDKFIEPLEFSRIRLNENLLKIKQIMTNPDDQEKLDELQSLIITRIKMCDEKIQLRRDKGLEEAAKAVGTGQGEHLNQQIRIKMDSLIQDEKQIVGQLQANTYARKNYVVVAYWTSLISGLSLILFVLSGMRQQAKHRMHAEAERNKLISILEATTDIIGTADLHANLTYVNKAGQSILGIGDKPLSKLSIADFHPNWATELIMTKGIPSAKQQGSWQGETAVLTAEGHEIPVSQVILAHHDEHGNISFISSILRDIRELKKIQNELKESEQRYRLQVEYAPEAILVLDAESGYFVDANTNALNLYGMSRAELFKRTPIQMSPVFQSDGRCSTESAVEKIHEAQAGGAPVFEWLHLNAAGQEITCEVRLLAMPARGRSLIRVSVTDITERKKSEKALRIRDNAIKTALNAVGMTDLNGNLIYVNDAFVALWGYANAEEMINMNVTLLCKDPNKAYEIISEISGVQQSWKGELIGIKKSGELFVASMSASMALGANGEPIAMIGSFLDISERIRMDELQRQMLHRLDTIANASPALLWNSGLDKGCDWFNRRWLEFTGRSIEQEKGNGWAEGVHPDDFERCISIYRSAFDARQPFSMEYRLRRHDGEYRWLLDQGIPRYDAEGVFIGYIGSCLDVSENKQINAELQRFKTTLDLTQDCVFMFSPDTLKFFYVNKGAVDQVGYSFNEMLAMTPLDIKPEYDETRFRALISPLLAGEKSAQHFETLHKHKDGHNINVEISLQYIAPANEPARFIAIVRDITLRKITEQTLKDREAFYRGVIEASPDSFWLLDTEGKLLQVSDTYVQRSGYSQEELLNMRIDDLEAEIDAKVIFKNIQKTILEKNTLFETKNRAKNGIIWPVEVSIVYMPVAGGRFFCFVRDISERKQANDKLRNSETLLKEAQRLAQIGNWELDVVNNKLTWSDEIYRIFEIDPAGFIASYEGFLETVHPDDRLSVNAAYLDSVKNHTEYSIVHRLLLKDGRIKYVHERAENFYSRDQVVRSIGTVQDVTVSKLAEEELQIYRNHLEALVKNRTIELEAVNHELEAFAYSVSHDLRAPLRSIDGFSQALIEDYRDKLDITGLDFLNRVRNASQRMGILIDDLLKLSRITRAELHHIPVDLSGLARSIVNQLQQNVYEHSVDVVIQSGLQASGDPGLLKIALENLLGNAWKFSANKSNPHIEFGSMKQNDETVYFVTDNGLGFDMQYADKLFGAFQRLHQREQFEGTGIGLATVKRIIQRHAGRIWAESKVDHKTTFFFTLSDQETESKV